MYIDTWPFCQCKTCLALLAHLDVLNFVSGIQVRHDNADIPGLRRTIPRSEKKPLPFSVLSVVMRPDSVVSGILSQGVASS